MPREPAIWFPAVRAGTGVDVSTKRLAQGLTRRGIRTEITWLPHRAEYAPWSLPIPQAPVWANIVHVNSWIPPRVVPAHLPLIVNLRHSVHDPALRPYKGPVRAAYHRWWIAPNERRLLRRAARIVAVSRYAIDIGQKYLLNVPMAVIYNGIDTDRFHPGNRERKAGDPFWLLYVGTWQTRKGVDLLPAIMRELGAGFELRFTGGPAAAKDWADMPPNMRDIGRLEGTDAVVAAMQDADAFLFPSRSEGFGLVAAEATACGLPVIAARASSLLEVVEDDVSGMLCAPDDVMAFAGAARKLAADHAFFFGMSRAARRAATRDFSIDAMLDAYVDVYQGISRD